MALSNRMTWFDRVVSIEFNHTNTYEILYKVLNHGRGNGHSHSNGQDGFAVRSPYCGEFESNEANTTLIVV